MREKGKVALDYFREQNNLRLERDEKIKKIDLKNQIKKEENEKGRKIAENFREEKILEQQKIDENDKDFDKPNVIEKIYHRFHNMGNKIDYSTTRFHNVVVIKHDEEEIDKFISAQEKAINENMKTENIKKIKNKSLEKFKNETKLNAKELLRKDRAKNNLNKLNEELNKINDFKNKNKSSKNLM